MTKKSNFSGYATRFNTKCSDGRIITKDAFSHQNGAKVPLVWSHTYSGPDNVLGYGVLELCHDGVRVHGTFNETEKGKTAKELVTHGDITALSIHANQLQQQGCRVMHGQIREVSLVVAGANPGAFIDTVSLSHSADGTEYMEAIIYSGEEDIIMHSDSDENYYEEGDDMEEELFYVDSDGEVYPVYDEDGNENVYVDEDGNEIEFEACVDADGDEVELEIDDEDYEDESDYEDDGDESDYEGDGSIEHSDTLEEVFDSMNDQQQIACYAMVEQALELSHGDQGGDNMARNVFENNTRGARAEGLRELMHSDFANIMEEAKRNGSFKEAALSHAQEYGIENIEILFPDAKNNGYKWLERETEWVSSVISGCSKTPFSRVKSVFADMNFDEARARGYIKATEKREVYFKASKRITTPYTIYVKQKLDRDDIIDVTDFDIVAMVMYQLRTLLNEEIARAILFGDGRDSADEHKINEENIRPIWKDAALFTVVINDCVKVVDSDTAAAFVEKVAFSHKEYKGSGNPTMYMTSDLHTRLLWVKDLNKRRIYTNDAELCSALRIKNIVEIQQMENLTRTVAGKNYGLMAIKVNLSDYNCGADKGGQIASFSDFDIDFNQNKYLMETRLSGALVKPYSAIVYEFPVSGTLSAEVPVITE